jgi:hypothetical protein
LLGSGDAATTGERSIFLLRRLAKVTPSCIGEFAAWKAGATGAATFSVLWW